MSWWFLEKISGPNESKRHVYITDSNGQKLYFYIFRDSTRGKVSFKLGDGKDRRVKMSDMFQINACS